jgi:hypothetical protein
MPIEIKELVIKVTVKEEESTYKDSLFINPVKLDELKSEIVKDCTQKVLEKLKEKQER